MSAVEPNAAASLILETLKLLVLNHQLFFNFIFEPTRIFDMSMNHYCEQWIADWCQTNGWTDWFKERSSYWAFPPNSVMPVPIPSSVLLSIKAEKGLSNQERLWSLGAIAGTVLAAAWGYAAASPMPLMLAFVGCAIVFAQLDSEEA
ncbi:hypothetical protein LEP3755_52950 [Leptolyngbya sp. NIES-3755]|nr:hypothetical protein LEP3755_52950 [Leptolyngbya sp. NIES-3755]